MWQLYKLHKLQLRVVHRVTLEVTFVTVNSNYKNMIMHLCLIKITNEKISQNKDYN